MSTLLAVGHILGTAASQVAATVGAHGVVAALPHVANIAGATVGWLASGTTGAAVLTGAATAATAGIAAGVANLAGGAAAVGTAATAAGTAIAHGAAAVGAGILKAVGVAVLL